MLTNAPATRRGRHGESTTTGFGGTNDGSPSAPGRAGESKRKSRREQPAPDRRGHGARHPAATRPAHDGVEPRVPHGLLLFTAALRARPEADDDTLVESIDSGEPFDPALAAGDRVRFHQHANPVEARDRKPRRVCNHDVHLFDRRPRMRGRKFGTKTPFHALRKDTTFRQKLVLFGCESISLDWVCRPNPLDCKKEIRSMFPAC